MLVAYWVVCVTFGIYELYKSLFGPDQELFLVPPVPSEIRFLYVLVIAIVLFGLCRPKIREYFSVSNKKMIEMLLFQIAISGVLLFIIEWS